MTGMIDHAPVHCVLAAIDLGDSGSRLVLHHAAGFARLLGLPLRVMHVAADSSAASQKQEVDFCAARRLLLANRGTDGRLTDEARALTREGRKRTNRLRRTC